MAKVTYCDVCYCPIKLGDKKFILGVLQATEMDEQDIKNFEKSLYYNRPYQGTKLYEICEGCKDVLEHFFHLRKDELESVKEQLENLAKDRKKR